MGLASWFWWGWTDATRCLLRVCSARAVGPQGQGEGSAFLAFRLPSPVSPPPSQDEVPAFMTHQCGKAARDATFRSSMQLGSRFGAVHRWVDQYYLLVILLLPRFLVLHGLMDSWLSRERGRIFRHLFLALASTVLSRPPLHPSSWSASHSCHCIVRVRTGWWPPGFDPPAARPDLWAAGGHGAMVRIC